MMKKKTIAGGGGGGHGGGMGRWLMTYADLITLLLIFFVIMYALTASRAQQVETLALKLSEQATAGNSILDYQQQGTPQQQNGPLYQRISKALAAMQAQQAQEQKSLQELVKRLQQYIDQNGLASEVSVNLNRQGVVVSFQDVALFPSGSAELSPQARQVIDAMARPMLGVPNQVRVEGFTDDQPIHTEQFPSNWELSTARATSVLEELVHGAGFPPERLSATGYGPYRPKVPNTSAQNRQMNRRVDLVVLRSIYSGGEPDQTP